MIKKDTPMLLIRFNNYNQWDFVEEHKKILQANGYVWMLKLGRVSNSIKISNIIDHGGYMILKSPKKSGSFYYLAAFTECQVIQPDDEDAFPAYYQELLNDAYVGKQWFKVNYLRLLNDNEIQAFTVSKTKQPIVDVVGKTRTAYMFVENTIDLQK